MVLASALLSALVLVPRVGVSHEVAQLREGIRLALDPQDGQGRKVGDAKFGVYAFYDYDGEPIYVRQTSEKLRVRIRRHLTNHRTDAVAMNVLDPFKVAEIEMWPLWGLTDTNFALALNSAEFSVYEDVLVKSRFHAVLHEKAMPQGTIVELPTSYRVAIVPRVLHELRSHPDIGIARRSQTIAALAKVVSEREVSPGLRLTLVTQARRLLSLAERRYWDFADEPRTTSGEDD